MTWFKLDDSFGDHRKVVRAGNAATGLWVRACTWSARHLTDGRIPREVVETFGSRAEIERASAAGLWVEVDGEFLVPDWPEYQPTAAEIRERRAKDAERKRRGDPL